MKKIFLKKTQSFSHFVIYVKKLTLTNSLLFSSKMGNRTKGKIKKKSIKSKATNVGSKRKLARFGKDRKKGMAGTVVNYISRTKAIKKLQITLRDFRRLCILKGVYPRDPKKSPDGKSKTYYSIKDIYFLVSLLFSFRLFITIVYIYMYIYIYIYYIYITIGA